MQQLLTAGFLASGDGADFWNTVLGVVLHHTVYAVSLIVGGALSGAGQLRGIIYGALVGFVSGLITFCIQDHKGDLFPAMLMYAEPIIHLATGALGGAVGMVIWRPTPTLPELAGNTPIPIRFVGFSLGNALSGPVHVTRVCMGPSSS